MATPADNRAALGNPGFGPNPHPAFGGTPTEPILPPGHPGNKELPDNFTERLVGLATAHPWMPHQTVAALAGLPASDQAVSQMAVSLRNTFGSVDNAVKYVTSDPLLQKTPSLGLYIRSYLTNTIGPWPLADEDLKQVQSNLQKQGWGKGLPTDGVWTTGWNGAYTQYISDLKEKQLGGNQPGSEPFGVVLNALNSLLPRQAATAVGAYIQNIPSSVVHDLHTLAGSVGGTAYDISHPGTFLHNPVGRLTGGEAAGQNAASAAAENAIGAHVTPEQSFTAESTRSQLVDTTQIIGDLLATHGLLRAGSAVASAARETNWKGLDLAAAQRGPGTIASKLFGPVVGDSKAPLLSPRAAVNVPILRMTGPVADKIAGGDGYYYRARTLLATPYAVPGVKVAGAAVGQLGLAGAKIRGIGSAESLLGGQNSELSNAIDHYQTINQFDDAVRNRLQLNAFGHHFSLGINTLAWVLHPQLDSAGSVSASVGKDLSSLNDNVQEAFGPRTGFGLSVERGVNWTKHGDQRLSYDEMVQMAGGPSHFAQFWTSKIFEHVAAHLAEDEWRKMPPQEQAFLVGPGAQYQDANAAMADIANGYLQRAQTGQVSDLLRGASEMTADHTYWQAQWGGHSGVAKAIAGEIDRSGMSPRAWLAKYMVPYGAASKVMREVILPRRGELSSDEVPGANIGMVPKDYLFRDQALTEANALEKRYNDAIAAVKDETNPASGKEKWQEFENAASAIRAHLLDNYGIDGFSMPQNDSDMIKLLQQKADAQLPRLFPRLRPTRMAPGDEQPMLHAAQPLTTPEGQASPAFRKAMQEYNQVRDQFNQDPTNPDLIDKLEKAAEKVDSKRPKDVNPASLRPNYPTGSGQLDRFTSNPLLTKVKPSVALELIHESASPAIHSWTNDRRLLGEGGGIVTVEHDPAGLRGEIDKSRDYAGDQAQRGSARFLGQVDRVDNGAGFNEDIRSISFKSNQVGKGKEGTALRLLRDKLQQVGYIKVDGDNGAEKWVRPDLMGGTVAASDEVKQALAELDRMGMAPVQGKSLGTGFYNEALLDLADSHLTRGKRFIESLGLSPENVPSADLGFTWQMNFHRLLLDAVESGKVKLYPTHSPETVIAMMRDRKSIPASMGTASLIQRLSPMGRHAYDINFDRITQAMMARGLSEKDAQAQTAAQMSQALENPLGLAHVTKRDLKLLLGRRPSEEAPNQAQMAREAELRGIDIGIGGQEMYDQKSRDVIYDLIQKANAMQPARLVGWQKAEALTALGLSYAGKTLPGAVGRQISYLPTRLVTLRNKARFTLSPEFQLRRVVKVLTKGSLDGVPPTFFPMRYLMRDGQKGYNERMSYLDRVMPELKNTNYDEGTQAMYAEDPWGIYNHRNFEAYFAWHWKQMGKTDSEVRQLLIKDFSYGSKAYGEGRSALERSANFVFFPLSFDKTLYRNVGAYMMDHTAQRLIFQAGLEAYDRYNQSDPNGNKLMSSQWWQDHAPVINEALRLNAFAHGIGLGQFGGINAPLLNLFIPQSYASTSQGVTLLRGIMPVIKQFQQLYTESSQTFKVSRQLVADQFINNPTLQGFKGKQMQDAEALQEIFYAKPVAETDTASLTAAYLYRRKLQALFKSYVDYNAHHTDKLNLGTNTAVFGEFVGHAINATLVDDLVHQKYPTFPIDDPSVFYAKQAAALETYKLQGHQAINTWIDSAVKYGKAIYAGKVDSAQAAQATKVYRQYAIYYAETVPGFLTFYNKNFRWQYGPLEKVR